MNYLVQNRRLMKRLGFVADPLDKPQIVPSKEATYWRHQPSGTCVVTFHNEPYTEAQIMRTAIHAAIYQTLRAVDSKVSPVISRMRGELEEQAIAFQNQQRKPKRP